MTNHDVLLCKKNYIINIGKLNSKNNNNKDMLIINDNNKIIVLV